LRIAFHRPGSTFGFGVHGNDRAPAVRGNSSGRPELGGSLQMSLAERFETKCGGFFKGGENSIAIGIGTEGLGRLSSHETDAKHLREESCHFHMDWRRRFYDRRDDFRPLRCDG
jgi:hypothetical protein